MKSSLLTASYSAIKKQGFSNTGTRKAAYADRKKQGFRAPIGEWIKKDEDYFYESIKEFNSLVNLFSERELKKVLQGNDFQKKWYLVNLSRWHMTRVAN